MTSVQQSKSNFLLVMSLFGVLVVGGTAVALNSTQNIKSGASNIDENLSDKLVKRGTTAFSPCKDLDIKYTYALIGKSGKNENGKEEVKRSPEPRKTEKPEVKKGACTPLVVQASLAEPFVGKKVSVTGTFQSGVFFATKVSDANMPNENSDKNDNSKVKPSISPRPVGKIMLGTPKVDPIRGTDPQN